MGPLVITRGEVCDKGGRRVGLGDWVLVFGWAVGCSWFLVATGVQEPEASVGSSGLVPSSPSRRWRMSARLAIRCSTPGI